MGDLSPPILHSVKKALRMSNGLSKVGVKDQGKAQIESVSKSRLEGALRPTLNALARIMISDRRAIALLDAKGTPLLLNQSARQLGLDQPDLTTRLDWSALRQTARRAGRAPIEWHAQGQNFEGELLYLRIDPLETFYLRLSDSDNEAIWLRNRARAANLMRVAHDLRTPIQALLAASQALSSGTPSPDSHEQMRQAAELCMSQINRQLASLRGEPRPDDDFDIAAEIEALITMIRPIAQSRATKIAFTQNTPKGLRLHGPLRHLKAVVQNLIDNSVNHGGGNIQLQLFADPTPSPDDEGEIWKVTLQLRDEGGGLPSLQKERLAAALAGTPIKDKTLRERQSAGLEVLAHGIDHLGGNLEVQNIGVEGEVLPPDTRLRVMGSLFTLTFSLPRVADLAPAPLPQTSQAHLAGRCVMLIEDSPSARDWLQHVLQAAGAQVHAVGSGPEALALLSRQEVAKRIELILSDVTLPLMNGIELCGHILRGDPATAQKWQGPIVGLTAHADDIIRAACLRAGMVMVLEKPIGPKSLCTALAQILAGETCTKTEALILQGDILDMEILQSLSAQMGKAAVARFMQRALDEARQVHGELLASGLIADSGRRLHAATGACGLTGLRAVEKALRQLEKTVETAPQDFAQHLPTLAQALTTTQIRLQAL